MLAIGAAIHIRRHGSCFDAPFDGLGGNVNRHQFVTVLHGRVDGGAAAIDPQMAGRAGGGHTLHQRQVLAIPAVKIHMVQAVGGRDEPFHVRAEAQMVRVHNAAHRTLHLGGTRVYKSQGIAERVGHDDRFFIGRQVQMVRLFARGNSGCLGPGHRVDDADVGLQRIEHKKRRRARCDTGNGIPQPTEGYNAGACNRENLHKTTFNTALECSAAPAEVLSDNT